MAEQATHNLRNLTKRNVSCSHQLASSAQTRCKLDSLVGFTNLKRTEQIVRKSHVLGIQFNKWSDGYMGKKNENSTVADEKVY